MYASLGRVIKKTLVDMMMLGRTWSEESHNLQHEHQRSRRIGGTHPEAHLPHAERVNPDEARCNGGKPTARKAQILSGRGKDREAKAGSAERLGETITRRIGQYPARKGADAILVDYPKKDAVKEANRGES